MEVISGDFRKLQYNFKHRTGERPVKKLASHYD